MQTNPLPDAMRAVLSEVDTHDASYRLLMFWCPGCEMHHGVHVPHWTWDGSMERPTFSPSLLSTYGDERRCHIFVRDGQIEFLGDCTHNFAGKTVSMQDYPCEEHPIGEAK